MIINSAKNEFRRAVKYGTTDLLVNNGVDKIRSMLRDNGYPDNILSKALSEVREGVSALSEKSERDGGLTYLCLPYISEANCRRVFYILRKNNMYENTKVTFRPGDKLKDILTSTKLRPTKCNAHEGKCYLCDGVGCMRKSFCYLLKCTVCSQTYVGESGRFYRNRMWEHYQSVEGGNKATAMGSHYLENHSEIEAPERPFEHQALRFCRDFPDRLIAQSVYIKYLSPTINTQHNVERENNGGWVKNTWQIL